jgi:hypothetical protein
VADAANGEATIGIFYASTSDGVRFGRRQAIPTSGIPHHPRVVIAKDGRLIAVWDESANGSRRIAVASGNVDPARQMTFKREQIGSSEAAVYPAIAVAGDVAIVAWTSGASASSSIRVHRVAGGATSSH